MGTQYVEHLRVPVERHVFRDVVGRGKTRKTRTACEAKFDPDEVIVLSFADTEVNGRAPAPMCRACTGDVEDAEPFTDEAFSRPVPNGKPAKCDSEPPMNGHSNQACTLPNRHTNAHANGKVSWSGEPGVWQLIEVIPDGKRPNGKQAIGKSKRLAAQGVDALLSPAPAPLRLEQLDVDDIERSPLNHRTRFDGIDELGVDIKANGLRVPIKVRPMPADAGSKKPWQLVYGERRWRAAKAAKVKLLPSLIADLTDLEVIKEQLVENVSRSDVHPLEEADGYQALIEKHGYDAQRIADETGKSKAYVYARLKLTSLAPAARVEFFAGRLNASIALLIARIPDMSLQDQATREVMGETTTPKYGPDHDALTSESRRLALVVDEEEITGEEDDDPELLVTRGKAVRVPMSVREAQLHLQRRYMLRLELAKFPIDDATLLPSAGACTTCEFRTGNQRELFADVASADVCTKPDCFAEKAKAEGDRRAREAEAKGAKVVTGKAAEKVFEKERRHDHPLKTTGKLTAEIAGSSPYVDPTERLGWGLLGNMGKGQGQTWDKLLGKKLVKEVPSVVVVHPETGEARELLDKGKAIEVLRKAGKLPQPKKDTGYGSDDWKKKHERDEKKREREEAIRDRAVANLVRDAYTAALEQPSDETAAEHLAWWKWLVEALFAELRVWKSRAAALVLDEDTPVNFEKRTGTTQLSVVNALKNADQVRAFVTAMLVEELAPFHGKPSEEFSDGLETLGLDWKKFVDASKKAQDDADKVEAAAAKAKEEKAPAKKAAKKKGRKS